CSMERAAPAPVTHFGAGVASPAGTAVVQPGDTVWRISRRYRLPLRDIIDLNALAPPYPIRAGQRLKLPPPVDYKVRPRDTLYGVARVFNVPVSRLVEVNNLESPYRLKAGQVLRIPSRVARREEPPASTLAAARAPRQDAVTAE